MKGRKGESGFKTHVLWVSQNSSRSSVLWGPWLSFCNWTGARRVHAFTGMLAVSTDQIIPNSVGDLALTQQESQMSVFLEVSTAALSKKYNLFLPQKFGSSQSQNFIQHSHHVVYSSPGEVIVLLGFRESIKYRNVRKFYGDWSHRRAKSWWQLLRSCQEINSTESLYPLFSTGWCREFYLFVWFWVSYPSKKWLQPYPSHLQLHWPRSS